MLYSILTQPTRSNSTPRFRNCHSKRDKPHTKYHRLRGPSYDHMNCSFLAFSPLLFSCCILTFQTPHSWICSPMFTDTIRKVNIMHMSAQDKECIKLVDLVSSITLNNGCTDISHPRTWKPCWVLWSAVWFFSVRRFKQSIVVNHHLIQNTWEDLLELAISDKI